jgi:hypothetical protein
MYLTLAFALLSYCSDAQSQIITTGNNVVNASNPYAADVVIGSDASGGIRHNSSIMWWSGGSASRISNAGDVFYYSVWNTTTPNIALGATLGSSSYFQGNVGIGTTTPTQKLDVKGSIVFGNINSNGRLSDEVGYASIVGGVGAGIRFYTNDGISQPLTLSSTGSVGINVTDTKGYQLAVNGNAIATSMTVKLYANWPDYVFKKEYNLPSLSEVKNYIDQNQHLPEMPSEQEVKDNGINLGEIVKVQTKKIEELTLYLIEKDKEIKEDRIRISALEKVSKLIKNK